MAYQAINLGTRGDNTTGDDINEGGVKINANFVELYNSKLESVVGGTNTTIDNTDPLNPIINVTVPSTITNTSDLINDGADSTSTYVENDEIGALAALNTVSSTEIDNAAVTLAKMANANAFSIIGNNTASPATPLYLTTAQVRSLLNVEDGAAANQTLSIVGDQLTISGTGGNTITIPTGGSVVVDSVITDGSTNPVQNNAIHDALADINSFVSVGNIAADKLIDGTGSGLDADLLDGLQSTQFLRSDTSDTFTGTLNLSTGSSIDFGGASVLFDIGTGAHTRWTLENGNLYINDNTLGDFVTFNGTSGKVFFQQDIEVQDEIYSIAWNGSLEVPTKNALYDKIESLVAPNLATVLSTGNSAGSTSINMNGQNITSVGAISATSSNITTMTAGTVSVNDQAYSVAWNGSLAVPTRNAVYDKIETITPTSGSGTSGVTLIGTTSGSYTITSQSWRWARSGNLVTFTVKLTNVNGTTPTGPLRMELAGTTIPDIAGSANDYAFSAFIISAGAYYPDTHVRNFDADSLDFYTLGFSDTTAIPISDANFASTTITVTGSFIAV